MINPLQALAQGATPRPSAELALFKPGQVLEAVVIGRLPDGTTALRIGEAVIAAQLPQQLPAGTTLQLQVKTVGPAPQLALVGAPQMPAAAVTAPQMPLPPVVQSVPLQVVMPDAAQPTPNVGAPSTPAAQPPAILQTPLTATPSGAPVSPPPTPTSAPAGTVAPSTAQPPPAASGSRLSMMIVSRARSG